MTNGKTLLFRFKSTDVTTTSIIDVLLPQFPLTKNKLFVRHNKVGQVYVTHYRKTMLASLKIDNILYPLTARETNVLNIFYTQNVG